MGTGGLLTLGSSLLLDEVEELRAFSHESKLGVPLLALPELDEVLVDIVVA
jgi:hypothetical protein